ncbi:MAG: Crp/Fnr family transcriptional regulator [Bacteroidetes bacterium]|nr:MAG: Crp/Fnr family transcriptional regulator [Bacteroidota bacterium]RLD95447.1 MAG: Crp/Fnr family transcriptional regulator [Bacteroidota bacterium]RLE00255.1 MAG: Crp/Fnr family transcriptional regulator [Bacteroidota bacterium]
MAEQNHNQDGGKRQNEPDCFQLISREDLKSLSENRTQITYLKGETIFKQGAFAPHVLFIQSGLIRVYLQTGRNKVQNLWISKSGDFLAFSSMFGERTYSYSAVAMKDSELLMIDKENLIKLLQTNPEFGFRITSKNFNSEKYLMELVASLSYKQMRGKLATALLYLDSDTLRSEEVFNYLTRQDIADFASISVESVIKFLKEFEKEGILSLVGKDIVITDPGRLSEISATG